MNEQTQLKKTDERKKRQQKTYERKTSTANKHI